MRRSPILLCIWLWGTLTSAMANEPIKIGMTAAFSGPAAALGLELRTGIEAYFHTVNQQGGIRHRPLKLIAYDDGYEPMRAAANLRRLITEDKVLATIGNVGTPTAMVTVPITIAHHTLMFGAFSGGDILRPTPPSRYIINYRPSYARETQEIINGVLAQGISAQYIAFFTQLDRFGDAIYESAITALHEKGWTHTENLIHGRYVRNTENVEEAVARILEAKVPPKVVIMAGSYKPCAKFITLLQQHRPDIWFIHISFVGTQILKQELGQAAHHIVVTQVVPPLDSGFPIIDEYKAAFKAWRPDKIPNDISLEGFIIAKLFCDGLRQVTGTLTRETLIDAMEQIQNLDLGLGQKISYDSTDHEGISHVWPVCLSKDKIQSFSWDELSQGSGK